MADERNPEFRQWWEDQEESQFVKSFGWTIGGVRAHDLAYRAWGACAAQVLEPEPQNVREVIWRVYWDEDCWAAEAVNAPGLVAAHEQWNELWPTMLDAAHTYLSAKEPDHAG